MMRTRMDFISVREDIMISFHHEHKVFDIYRETEIRSSVLMKCSIKEALFKKFFFFVFALKFLDHILTTF